jgi:hypothetical protein
MNGLCFSTTISACRWWVIVSSCMAYLLLYVTMFYALAIGFCTCIFSKHLYFLTSGFLPCFLVDFPPLFMLERIGLRKLFTKLSYCRTLCSFFRVQMVNCSQCSYIMLLSKLTPSAAKPPTRLEGVLPMGPRSATNGRAHCLRLVLYPEHVTS